MINKSFNNFINKKQLNEIAGRGGHLSAAKKRLTSINIPTGYPGLSSVLNLIHNSNIRRNFLIWIVGEGLMQASEGREELLFLLKNNPNKILKEQNLNFYKFQKLKEMARDPRVAVGREEDRNTITSHDIFSPKARSENEKLGSMADRIDKYYEKNYEPKEAVIVSSKGQYLKINLEELRKKCQELGIPEFKYGGTEGYIQYIEKGDYLDESLKNRDIENLNNQWGPDLRPDNKSRDDEGNILPSITKNKKSGRSVYHFMGGSYEEVPNQISAVIRNMSSEYSKIMRKAESDPVLSSEFENFKRFGKKIETFEDLQEYLETKKGRSILQKIGFPDYRESAEFMRIPKFVSPEFFKDMVLNGIKITYPDKDESTRQRIFQNLFEKEGFIKTRIRWSELKKEEEKTNKNKKILLRTLLENTLKDLNYIKSLFNKGFTIYVSSGEKHGPDVRKTATKEYLLDVNFENPNDSSMGNPFLEKLISNGFYWERNVGIKKERINKNPFNDPNLKKIKLTNNKDVYIVYKKNNKFYINMPDLSHKGIQDSNKKTFGNPVLGSSKIMIRGQKTDTHHYTNPGSKKQAARLIEQLKRGLLGEAPEKVDRTIPPENWQSLPVIFNDVMDLPSVRLGVQQAKKLSKVNHTPSFDGKEELWFAWYKDISGEYNDIPGFAVEATKALEMNSNEKSFLSGWITEKEINDFKGKIRSKKFQSLENELNKYGLEQKTIDELLNLLKSANPDEVAHNLEHKALRNILGRNALRWRANNIALHVKRKIDIEFRKYQKEQKASIDASSGNDDSGTMAGNIGSRGYESQEDYEDDNSKHLTRSQIEDLIQQHGMTPEIQTPPTSSLRSSTRIKSRPVFDPSKFRPRYKDQDASTVAGAPTSSTPVFDPSSFIPRYKDQESSAVAGAPTSSTPVFDPSSFIPRYKDQESNAVDSAPTSAETPKQGPNKYEPLKSYRNWKQKNEMVGTFVVSPKKPKDGCGYNIWGAAGKPAVSITGEPIKKKKKKKNGK